MRKAFIALLCVAVMFVVLMNAQLQDSSGLPPRIAAVPYSGESIAAAVASARRRGDVRDGAVEAADTPSMVLLRGAVREEVLRARTALRSWLRNLDSDDEELQKELPTMESNLSSSITARQKQLETADAQRRTLGHSLAVVEMQQKIIDAQRTIITTMRKSLRSSSAEVTDPDTALPVHRPRRVTPLSWAVEGESAKSGAGLLLFAYGGRKTLQHFVREAQYAAASFREHNPTLPIAIVTNNETVDRRIFTTHIMPRADLLFAGENDQNRSDKVPRQWLTRLYYLAQSPYHITWALDSNVNVLTETMYPHNFNLVVRWSAPSAALMRDWLLLSMRQLTADDS
ncbi:hypothetical protein Ctob_003272 [Chrysochromulina tobinii]|uniref:Uncharacterized protein n=1 Tax=Chrysochromulina tobinii TaxID=1460289 RepID=A0A0M0JC77_9EUKA|nr:hypothetical protein Ctob_003272 [Chrysochromulina tobinii]|eukprot:KOO24080.1 hypothetical protein Ctob_003272 [Chrysochromulina sp. CCMP291]